MVKGLLEKDPKKRLGAKDGIQEIKSHAFFSDLCWDDVYKMKTKYDRQFLRIDMINSNFNQDNSNDAFNIGIQIEDECNYDEEQGAHQIFNSGNYDNTHFDIITPSHSK